MLGNEDEKVKERMGTRDSLPMDAAQIMQHPFTGPAIGNVLETLELGSAYTVEYESPYFTTMTFADSLTDAHNEFKFTMVNGMAHIYPNSKNHRSGLSLPDLFWAFFLQHPRD